MRPTFERLRALSVFTLILLGPRPHLLASGEPVLPVPAITAVDTPKLPLGIFTTSVEGTGFIAESSAELDGKPLHTFFSNGKLIISGFSSEPGIKMLTVHNGPSSSVGVPVEIGVLDAKVSPATARRFLEQAAFGPSPRDATHVQALGLQGWLDEQFAMPQSSSYKRVMDPKARISLSTQFFMNATSNPDQLRQRVAFALSQIFVTSVDKVADGENMPVFQDLLLADSFGNYRQIMQDVTLSSAMGQYLDMANNEKGDKSKGTVANENYARELMQLFTVGPSMLNQDGSFQLDKSGLPIPVYSQFTVTEFSRVFTGWTYPFGDRGPVWPNGPWRSSGPMAAYPSQHDFGSKTLLGGYVSPAKISPEKDLSNALDNIFNHPNVGPFVARLLIQHLVKSNPSPAYITRVATAFNNNGHQVRGDMRATIAAILLDPEARANDDGAQQSTSDGHLQEPALFIAGMIRALGGELTPEQAYTWYTHLLGQSLFASPSVFNYYSPDYVVPNTGLTGGEFEINSPNAAIVRANMVSQVLLGNAKDPFLNLLGTKVSLAPFVPMASDPPSLVRALDLTFTHGTMPSAMKAVILEAVKADTGSNLHKVQTGCYLVLSSNYYNVWH